MCGRFTLTSEVSALQEMFPWLNIPPQMQPRYNVAPSQPVAVVANDGKNSLDFFTWGLIPSWTKAPNPGEGLINARAETLADKPSFRSAFRRRRCLILADGFYEWRKEPTTGRKTPMYIRLVDGKPFAFAGLWEDWHGPDGSEIKSCAIITTTPNSLMASIHNRMPVILPAEHFAQWLAPGEVDPRTLSALLAPYPAQSMQAYPVSPLVNNPKADLPEMIQPAP